MEARKLRAALPCGTVYVLRIVSGLQRSKLCCLSCLPPAFQKSKHHKDCLLESTPGSQQSFRSYKLAQRKLKLKDDLSDIPHATLCQLAIIWFIFWEVSRTSPERKALKVKIKSQGYQYSHQICTAF